MIETTAGGPCPVCGARHAMCGPGSAAVPVDLISATPEGDHVTTRKYRTTVNGHQTTLKLSDADVKTWQGDELTEITDEISEQAPEQAPEVPEQTPETPDAETKARRQPAANKARAPQTDKS